MLKNLFKLLETTVVCSAIFIMGLTHSAEHEEGKKPVPATAVEVTPEEFKDLKNEEISSQGLIEELIPRPNLNLVHSGSGKEVAILIFAIVGTTILFAWIPYAALLSYRVYKNPDRFKFKSMITLQYMGFLEDNKFVRSGYMTGTRLTTYVDEFNLPDDNVVRRYYGFNIEYGYFYFSDKDDETMSSKYHYKSDYWLVGPSIIFSFFLKDPRPYFKLDLLAGSSLKKDNNLILRADFSANVILDHNVILGFGFGANYVHGKNTKGIVSYADELSTHGFGNIGYHF